MTLKERSRASGAMIRNRFFHLTAREKVLLLLVVGVVLYFWFTNQWERHDRMFSRISLLNHEGSRQAEVISEGPSSIQEYERAISEVNFEELPSREEANGFIDSLIRKYGFQNFTLSDPASDYGAPLSFHTFRLDVRKADFETLIDFTHELQSTLTYVTLLKTTIKAQASDPSQLNANFELRSIEYTP
ncbi:hypothetical protein MLD52_13235 [Puniceicoccaceae bacterium K14]|nr:hypothetical protein [Puniceicoccaceae bacterium K14]